jgi:hypothetical protein
VKKFLLFKAQPNYKKEIIKIMCKLFAVLDIEDKEKANKFAMGAIPFITKTDNHGLGIMRLGENGVSIRRWLTIPALVADRPYDRHLERYREALSPRANVEGTTSQRLDAIAIHGRYATCEKTLENTHPFYAKGSALMHNGVISNAASFTQKLSTCDSEALLWQYIKHEVRDKPNKLEAALNGVGGYYAAIVFNDNGVVDIWRDSQAELFLGYVKGVGTVVCTTVEIMEKAAAKAKTDLVDVDEIMPFTHIRWRLGQPPMVTAFEVTKPYLSCGVESRLPPSLNDEEIWQGWRQEDELMRFPLGEGV